MTGFALLPIHHVQLAIPPGGEDAGRAFWVGALDMTERPKPPVLAARGGCWFRGGALEVHLGIEDPFVPANKAHPGLRVDGLPALADRLEAAGYPVTWDDDFPGYDRFYVADPFGNRLEFLEPTAMSPTDVVRAGFRAYADSDRAAAERLMADDLVFSSPQDDRIDRAAWFERCFPTAQRFASQELLHLAPVGDSQVLVVYEYALVTGGTFRNTELHTVRGSQVTEVQVFFGPAVA